MTFIVAIKKIEEIILVYYYFTIIFFYNNKTLSFYPAMLHHDHAGDTVLASNDYCSVRKLNLEFYELTWQ